MVAIIDDMDMNLTNQYFQFLRLKIKSIISLNILFFMFCIMTH